MKKKEEIKKGDVVFCYKSLPFGESGRRKVVEVAIGHSVYVRLKPKDCKDQNWWQIRWSDFRLIKERMGYGT